MKAPHLMIALLVLAWVCVDAALVTHLLEQQARWPDPVAACLLGLLFGQTAMLCVWFAWSRSGFAARMAFAVTGLCLCSGFAAVSTDGYEHAGKWLSLSAAYALLIVAPLLVIRHSADAALSATAEQRRNRQFSLGTLFSWTTSAAILLGLSRWFDLPAKHPASLMGFCLLMAILSLVLLTISWRCRTRLPALIALSLLCPLFGRLVLWTGLPPGDYLAAALMVAASGTVILGSVAVVRIAQKSTDHQGVV